MNFPKDLHFHVTLSVCLSTFISIARSVKLFPMVFFAQDYMEVEGVENVCITHACFMLYNVVINMLHHNRKKGLSGN